MSEMESSNATGRQDWETPPELFAKLHAEFSFTLDLCAAPHNAKLPRFYTKEDSALTKSIVGERVFCNPPYGRGVIDPFIKMLAEGGADIAVGLLPSRTSNAWFHDYILGKAEIRFIRGRIKFVGASTGAMFPSLIAIWRAAK